VNTVKNKGNRTSYIYSILSVSLVLFLLGLLGVLLLNATRLSRIMKENVQVSVILKDSFKDHKKETLLNLIAGKPYVQSLEYVSKDDAAKMFIEEYGENFVELLDGNPLYASVNVRLNADFMEEEDLDKIEVDLLNAESVDEVFYQRNLLSLINENFKKLGIALLILSVLLLSIAITLIDSTIRLAMYSNRFLIKSMQLVGATRWLITKPFIQRSIWNGGFSGLAAGTAVGALLYFIDKKFPNLGLTQNPLEYLLIFSGIMMVGIFISYWSTRAAVRKYLKLKLDDLY